jgi:hypothetical protein
MYLVETVVLSIFLAVIIMEQNEGSKLMLLFGCVGFLTIFSFRYNWNLYGFHLYIIFVLVLCIQALRLIIARRKPHIK